MDKTGASVILDNYASTLEIITMNEQEQMELMQVIEI